ncbi:ribonuclease HI [Sinorhizobium meliloti]|uniref:ribonuclease HI n=1 Tax=Rhizobium meliloti TaxID=382 RepID=UPI0023807D20|nr:ribonuclease HI [Sinorhizobium meliloti]
MSEIEHSTSRRYLIHTDGACRGNPGPGGWGAVLQLKEGAHVIKEREVFGSELPETTNNRMELTAALKALQQLKEKNLPVTVRSDSKYLVEGMSAWIQTWKLKGWRTGNGKGKPVLNQDLWELLDARSQLFGLISWEWVRGHGGDLLNERCDWLANQAIDKALHPAKAA